MAQVAWPRASICTAAVPRLFGWVRVLMHLLPRKVDEVTTESLEF
jgi:hypothetical protein